MLANLYEWRNSKYPKAALKFLGAYSDFKSLISSKKKITKQLPISYVHAATFARLPTTLLSNVHGFMVIMVYFEAFVKAIKISRVELRSICIWPSYQ